MKIKINLSILPEVNFSHLKAKNILRGEGLLLCFLLKNYKFLRHMDTSTKMFVQLRIQ